MATNPQESQTVLLSGHLSQQEGGHHSSCNINACVRHSNMLEFNTCNDQMCMYTLKGEITWLFSNNCSWLTLYLGHRLLTLQVWRASWASVIIKRMGYSWKIWGSIWDKQTTYESACASWPSYMHTVLHWSHCSYFTFEHANTSLGPAYVWAHAQAPHYIYG